MDDIRGLGCGFAIVRESQSGGGRSGLGAVRGGVGQAGSGASCWSLVWLAGVLGSGVWG